ncbi:MAG: hypothetical protein M3R24_08830 [Chloroflexota bacterium]|nr:hypothetical protein [Chloroflexota bacterium]
MSRNLARSVWLIFPVLDIGDTTYQTVIANVELTADVVYDISQAIMWVKDKRDMQTLINFAGAVAFITNETTPPPANKGKVLLGVISLFYNYRLKHEWKDKADPALFICYRLLKDHRVTREGAFQIAQELLGEDAPKSANSWRVRVDAYAKDRGDSIGQPLRKPRKKSAKI